MTDFYMEGAFWSKGNNVQAQWGKEKKWYPATIVKRIYVSPSGKKSNLDKWKVRWKDGTVSIVRHQQMGLLESTALRARRNQQVALQARRNQQVASARKAKKLFVMALEPPCLRKIPLTVSGEWSGIVTILLSETIEKLKAEIACASGFSAASQNLLLRNTSQYSSSKFTQTYETKGRTLVRNYAHFPGNGGHLIVQDGDIIQLETIFGKHATKGKITLQIPIRVHVRDEIIEIPTASSTVGKLCGLISKATGTATALQVLSFRGEVLGDRRAKLSEIGITDGCTVHLQVLAPPPPVKKMKAWKKVEAKDIKVTGFWFDNNWDEYHYTARVAGKEYNMKADEQRQTTNTTGFSVNGVAYKGSATIDGLEFTAGHISGVGLCNLYQRDHGLQRSVV